MDNFYKTCMPLMDDGRNFTDYRSATRINEYVKYINSIQNNDEYRLFLQKNTNNIMDNEWNQYKIKSKCMDVNCIHTYPTRMPPQRFMEERLKYNRTFTSDNELNTHNCEIYDDYRMATQ